MRIASAIMISRLVLAIFYPYQVSAAEDNIEGTQNKINEEKSKIELVQDFRSVDSIRFETMQDSILTAFGGEPLKKNAYMEQYLSVSRRQRLESYVPPAEKVKILVTGYSSTVDQCDSSPFITASGTHVRYGTMACPPQYPLGTMVTIDNMGTFVCEDRGGAIKGNHFDMWFASREAALDWGKRSVTAMISK